jgi:hypothetical protein
MAANKTSNKSAHVSLTASTAYTVNLTGAGNVVKMTGHHHGANTDIYYVMAGTEAGLPTLTAAMDDSFLLHQNEVVITGKPLADCWIRFIATANIDVSAELHNQARS